MRSRVPKLTEQLFQTPSERSGYRFHMPKPCPSFGSWLNFLFIKTHCRSCFDIFEIFGSWSFFLRGFAMSTRGGRRIGSGRKRIYGSSATNKVWNRGHTRIWLDSVIYSSWMSAKSLCGHSSDAKFAGHLLSLERRRR